MVQPMTFAGPFFSLSLHDSYMECVQNTHEMAPMNIPRASWHLRGIHFGSGNENIKGKPPIMCLGSFSMNLLLLVMLGVLCQRKMVMLFQRDCTSDLIVRDFLVSQRR